LKNIGYLFQDWEKGHGPRKLDTSLFQGSWLGRGTGKLKTTPCPCLWLAAAKKKDVIAGELAEEREGGVYRGTRLV